jgi:tRNA threonylcarbamoyl adenosine modification protein (Sua5/YciO/YrdC/YwlC family)
MDRYPVNLINPHLRYVKKALEALRSGELICYPTDVNYGIACLLSSSQGVRNLNALTIKLEKNKLHTMICRDFSEVSQYAVVGNDVFKLMKKIMPGPYTIILEAKSLVPRICQTKRKTIGVRIIDSPVVNSLLNDLDAPLLNFTAISSSNTEPLEDISEIEKLYSNAVSILLDAGEIPSNHTTVLDCTEGVPMLVRRGLGQSDPSWMSKQESL